MSKYENVIVESLDIQPEQGDVNVTKISQQVRKIVERNHLKPGENINADILVNVDGEEKLNLATITYQKKTSYEARKFVVESGYHSDRFDEGYDEEDCQA